MKRPVLFSALVLCAACDLGQFVQPEVRVGAAEGIPSIAGSTEVELATFVCGNDIPAGMYTVTTRKVSGGCELSFDKDVEIVTANDYSKISALNKASALLTAVELKITKLSFTDVEANAALDPETRISSATLSINGQVVGDKSLLTSLPKTVTLTGSALSELKAKIDQRQPASVRASSVVVLPETPAPPKKLKIDYDAQPTLVLGAGDLKI